MSLVNDTWPPTYDDTYLPDPKNRHWFQDRETMNPEEREGRILKKIRAQMAYAYQHAPLYRIKWKAAGLEPDDIKTLEDFHRVPVLTKQEIRQDQQDHPPFGSYLCILPAEIHRIHGTSGTTGKPTAYGIGREDWRRIANAHARIMWGMGLRPSDSLFIGSFFSLYIGSWGALVGAERLGMASLPFGAGVPGQTAMAIRWIKDVQPTAFYGTPSYALYLAEVERKQGIEPARDFHFRLMFFSGEPGAGIPSTKRRIEETYGGATCIDSGSTGEMTPWITNGECAFRHGIHLWQDIVFTELVHPDTHQVVPYDSEGVPVYTHLERTSQPMIRFYSGDLATWTNTPCECGRTYPRLPKGIYGRVDDMFIVRGENIYPSAIEEILRSIPDVGQEYRLIISREEAMDELVVQAEYTPQLAAGAVRDQGILGHLQRELERRLKSTLGVRATVQLVQPDTLTRTEFKARRVIDNRDLFKELKGRT